MKAIELAREYYEKFGRSMIEEKFPQYSQRIAVGLCGHGSECFGFDDEVSRDHDYEPGFCIWLTDEDYREFGFRLSREYSRLPKEFGGIKLVQRSLGASKRNGVNTVSEYYRTYTGRNGEPESLYDWLYTPMYYFAEATNGEVFFDGPGEFTRIRNVIKYGMPEDVRLKKIAANAFMMAQTGQYNFERCLKHGEKGASRIALCEFVKHSVETIFLINKKYPPYYKWMFRAMRELNKGEEISGILESMMTADNATAVKLIEEVSSYVVGELKKCGLTELEGDYLEPHAYAVNDLIKDVNLRNMHISEGA